MYVDYFCLNLSNFVDKFLVVIDCFQGLIQLVVVENKVGIVDFCIVCFYFFENEVRYFVQYNVYQVGRYMWCLEWMVQSVC